MAAVLAGCSGGTRYQAMTGDGGYSEVKLSDTMYEVRGRVNGSTATFIANNYAMLRASEIACLNGYRFFRVLDDSMDTVDNRIKKNRFKTSFMRVQLVKENSGTDYDAKAVMESNIKGFKSPADIRERLSCTY